MSNYVAKQFKVTVSCNLLRRTMVHEKEAIEVEAGEYMANQARTSNDVYAQLDYGEALSDIVNLWNDFDIVSEE